MRIAIIVALTIGLSASVLQAQNAAPQVTRFNGCIEKGGPRLTARDLKLRLGPCRAGELTISWPAASSRPRWPGGACRCWRARR